MRPNSAFRLRAEDLVTETSATNMEANWKFIRQAFEAWREGTGAITEVFAPDMVRVAVNDPRLRRLPVAEPVHAAARPASADWTDAPAAAMETTAPAVDHLMIRSAPVIAHRQQ